MSVSAPASVWVLCNSSCVGCTQSQFTSGWGKSVFMSGEILAKSLVKQSLVTALGRGSAWHSPPQRTPVWKTSRCACHSLYGSFTQTDGEKEEKERDLKKERRVSYRNPGRALLLLLLWYKEEEEVLLSQLVGAEGSGSSCSAVT